MIDVNVNERKMLSFKFDDLGSVKHAKFSVITPNNKLFTFPANIDNQQNKITVDLPVLSNIFRSEIISTCYLEMVDKKNKLLRNDKQLIHFHSNNIPLKVKTGMDISLPFPSIVLKKIHRNVVSNQKER